MTYSMIGQQRYFQDHQGRHTLLFMTYSGNAEIWQSDRHLSDLYGIQKLRSTLESFVGTSATLVGIKDATSFVRGCLLFAQMYYVEQFLYIEQVNCLTIARREEFWKLVNMGWLVALWGNKA